MEQFNREHPEQSLLENDPFEPKIQGTDGVRGAAFPDTYEFGHVFQPGATGPIHDAHEEGEGVATQLDKFLVGAVKPEEQVKTEESRKRIAFSHVEFEGIGRVSLKPPNLPELFTIALYVDLPIPLDSSNVEVFRLPLPDDLPTDVPSDVLHKFVEKIVILTPKWCALDAETRKIYVIEEQVAWLREVLDYEGHCSTEISTQFKGLLHNIPELQDDQDVAEKIVPVLLRLILTWSITHLTNLSEAEVTSEQIITTSRLAQSHSKPTWPPSVAPAEIVAVNVSHTPTLTYQDQSSQLSCSPMIISTPNSATWTPLPNTLVQEQATRPSLLPHPNRMGRRPSRSRQVQRSLSLSTNRMNKPHRRVFNIKSSTEFAMSECQSPQGNPNSPQNSYTNRRSNSQPEGLNGHRYYHLLFCPSSRTSARPRSVCEGITFDEQPLTIQFTEDPYIASMSFDVTLGSNVCGVRNNPDQYVRDQLCTLIFYSVMTELTSKSASLGLLTDGLVRELIEQFLDHAIAISLTHRMYQLSEENSRELSQLVSTASINVSRVMDCLLLEGFMNSGINISSPCSGNISGEERIYRLACKLIKQIMVRYKIKDLRDEKMVAASNRITRHTLQLAYSAACIAMRNLLKQPEHEQPENYKYLATQSPISRLSVHPVTPGRLAVSPIGFCTQAPTNGNLHSGLGDGDTGLTSLSSRVPNSPSPDLNVDDEVILEVASETRVISMSKLVRESSLESHRSFFAISRIENKCHTPYPVTNTELFLPEHLLDGETSEDSSGSVYLSESCSSSYADPESQLPEAGKPENAQFHVSLLMSGDVSEDIIPMEIHMKVSAVSWRTVPLSKTNMFCSTCSGNLRNLIQSHVRACQLNGTTEGEQTEYIVPEPSSEQQLCSMGEECIRIDPPTLSQCVSGVQLEQDSIWSSSTDSLSSGLKAETKPVGDTSIDTKPDTGILQNRPPLHQSLRSTIQSSEIQRSKKHSGNQSLVRVKFPNTVCMRTCQNSGRIMPTGDKPTLIRANSETQISRASSREPPTPTDSKKSPWLGSTDCNALSADRTEGVKIHRFPSSKCTSGSNGRVVIQSSASFYSCLEEVKECLHRAESRLEAVNILANHRLDEPKVVLRKNSSKQDPCNITTNTSSSLSPKRQWPSTRFHDNVPRIPIRKPALFRDHYLKPPNAHMNICSDPITNMIRPCRRSERTSNTYSALAYSRANDLSRGVSCFPAPSMELPIRPRPSVVRPDAGITQCLIYTKRLLRQGVPKPEKQIHSLSTPSIRFKKRSNWITPGSACSRRIRR